jgi:hypothetical protein
LFFKYRNISAFVGISWNIVRSEFRVGNTLTVLFFIYTLQAGSGRAADPSPPSSAVVMEG